MAEQGPEQLAGVRQGQILAGKYRIERVLGVGGIGVVVAARHIQLDTKVAIKFLLAEALDSSDSVARFTREAQAAVQITSEHVARVIDVGTLPNGAPYMVMEYLEGGDLAAWIKQRGALPIEQAVEFVLQACVAVADAHALGIVHRDLKPANLFCVRRSDGQLSIKVLDFGISKMTKASGVALASMTRTSALMGSPYYMSPEQMRSAKDVDAQTDIWALGVILFELITGRPAFLADSVTELAIKINGEPTPAIRSVRPDVPSGLEAILFKCLEKDRRQRYRNVAELALALLPFAPKRAKASVERVSGIIRSAGLSASALAVPPSPQIAGTQASPGTLPPFGRTTVGATGRKTAIVGAGLAGAVLLVAIVGSVVRWRHGPPDHRDSPVMAVQIARAAASPPVPAVPPPKPSDTQTVVAPAESPVVASHPATTTSSPQVVAHSPPAPTPTSLPVKPAAAAPQPAAPLPGKVDCDPPYAIDAAGHRQYKPECLK